MTEAPFGKTYAGAGVDLDAGPPRQCCPGQAQVQVAAGLRAQRRITDEQATVAVALEERRQPNGAPAVGVQLQRGRERPARWR